MPPVSASKASIAEPQKIASAISNRVMFSTKPTSTLSEIFKVHVLRTAITAHESKLDSYSPPLQARLLGSHALVSTLMKKRQKFATSVKE